MNYYGLLVFGVLSYSAHAQKPELRTVPDSSARVPVFAPRVPRAALPPGRSLGPPAVFLGLKLGGSLSTKVGENVLSEPQTTFLPGALVGAYHVTPLRWARPTGPVTFSLQTELLASLQGYRLRHPTTNYEVRAHLFYASLPVCVVAHYRQLFALVGLQAGYLVATRVRYEFNASAGSTTTVRNNTSLRNYRRGEAAFVAGAGYRWANGLGAELRYTQGLTNLFQANSLTLYATAAGQYNAVVQVQLSCPLVK
jgi:hypothetical protein